MRYILSMTQVSRLFAIGAAVLGFAGMAVWWGVRSSGEEQIEGRSSLAVAILASLIGANFLMVEHSLILVLFRRLYVYDDALGMGAIGFLTFSGVGSLLAGRRARPVFLVAGAAAMIIFLASGTRPPLLGVALAIPIALAAGMLFPARFELASRNPVAVFALDAIGAAWGALLSTFIPIIWGIDTFIYVSGTLFLVTLAVDAWLHGYQVVPRSRRIS